MNNKKLSRRAFLKWQMAAALGSNSFFPFLGNLSSAQAASIGGEYKALVCVFLLGGNDSFNMIVPRSSSAHAAYAAARRGLAINRDSLLSISPASYNDGNSYGFHPSMPEARQLFQENKLSILANVGMLAEPITKEQYEDKTKRIPPNLFSHADQQDLWMPAKASNNPADSFGWAGRMTDLMYPNPDLAPKPAVNLTTRPPNLWQTGTKNSPYEVSVDGGKPLVFPRHSGEYSMEQAYRDITDLSVNNNHKLVSHFADVQERSDALTELINTALVTAPKFSKAFPQEETLGKQLEMVAKLMAVRNNLDSNITRQVYFVGIGGWDTHDNQRGRHQELLQHLSKSLHAFNSALEELGLNNQVTTFTASEFGRSLTPNNDGTDHGWGGHNLIMGGSLKGGDIFGTMPKLEIDSPDALKSGRIIPTTSVEQYAATLASWFGLSSSEISTIFPNLNRFNTNNLGFLV
jgi:uncharacterized protein (DUF1501 family)